MGKGDFREAIKLFKEMKKQCPQFCFAVKENNASQSEEIIWMTAEMRKDLLQYSDCVFINMRKASMNDIGWCYFALIVKDNENMIQVVAEYLCCAESHDMYAWSLEQLPEFKPEYKLSSTHYMFADQLVTDDLLGMLGVKETCTLLSDNHYIFICFPKLFW